MKKLGTYKDNVYIGYTTKSGTSSTSGSSITAGISYWSTTTTGTDTSWNDYQYSTTYKAYTSSDKIDQLEKELEESKKLIKLLEKKLNDFIDDPDKVRAIRKNLKSIDPFEEEVWDE
jgi:hypothetical protein